MAQTQDARTYRKAATAALLGLGVQLLLSVTAAALGGLTGSVTLHAVAWYGFVGLPVWGVLWLVYHQHRLEREEALEAEQLSAADTDAARLFDEAGHDLAVARKRLGALYRWGLNVVSVTVAVYLLCAGLGMLLGYGRLIRSVDNEGGLGETGLDFGPLMSASALDGGGEGPLIGVVLGLLAGAALVGFLVARYVAGMVVEPAWAMLRGGATCLMGLSAMLALAFLGVVFAAFDNPVVLAVLTLAVPAFMVLLGVEVLLAFVLDLYRPRVAGEPVRPAFQSRLLGWISRPGSLSKAIGDTLNYQFGFEVSRSRLAAVIGRAVLPLLGIGVVALLALSSLVIVPPDQQALVTVFGARGEHAVRDAGVSFKPPWPLGQTQRFDVTRVRTLRVGSKAGGDDRPALLWTNAHGDVAERFFVSAPARLRGVQRPDAPGQDSGRSDSTFAGLVGGELVVHWRIGDLLDYTDADAATHPDRVLRALAEQMLAGFVAARDVDTLLTAERLADEAALKLELQTRADGLGLGVVVEHVGLYGVHPPQDESVAEAFLEVVNAQLEQRTAVSNAERDRVATLSEVAGSVDRASEIDAAIATLEAAQATGDDADAATDRVQRLIDAAGGSAAQAIAQARAARWTTALAEQARAEGFAFDLEAYRRAPDYFAARRYFDILAEQLGDKRKVVTAGSSDQPPLFRLDLKDQASGLDMIFGDDQ